MTDLVTLRRVLDRATAQRDVLAESIAAAQRDIDESSLEVAGADVALHAVRVLRDAAAARVAGRLTDLTTEALRVVFDDPGVALRVVSVERRGVVEADLRIARGDVETDPLDGNGGGLVADVAAVLRLVLVRMLTRRGLAPLLILDEPFAALSRGHQQAMAETLEEVAEMLGVQVIVVTHADTFARGNVFRVEWQDREALLARVVRVEED